MAEQPPNPPLQTKIHPSSDAAVSLVRDTWESTGIPEPTGAQYPAFHAWQYPWQNTMGRT